MATTPFLTPGRICLTLMSLSTSISCYIADFNESHVYNPKWPPHARFHNGQTMSMGAALGLTTLYFTWRPYFASGPIATKAYALDSAFCAALVGTIYWVTGLSAILYPGTDWIDPDRGPVEIILGLPGQSSVFAAHAIICWVGYALEANRLNHLKMA